MQMLFHKKLKKYFELALKMMFFNASASGVSALPLSNEPTISLID